MKEAVMYSIDNRQRKKLQEVRREAEIRQEELNDKIVEHDGLLADISAKRGEIQDILRKVTCDPNLQF